MVDYHGADEESSLLGGRTSKLDSGNQDSCRPVGGILRMGDFMGGLIVASAAFIMFHPAFSSSNQQTPELPIEQAALPLSYAPPYHNKPLPLTGPQSKYKKFQALGFQIYTGGAPAVIEDDNDNTHYNPECYLLNSYGKIDSIEQDDGSTTVTQTNLTDTALVKCYLGLNDPKSDVYHRLKIMEDAVIKAEQVSDKNPDVLKIFIAPEFFFRGKDGAYIFFNDSNAEQSKAQHDQYFNQDDLDQDCTEVCHILQNLEKLVANPKYQDWLFLFGTIIVSEVLPHDDPYGYLFYNFAPVYRGYDPGATDHHGKRFLVPKRYVSNIDFLTPLRHVKDERTREIMSFVHNPRHRTQIHPDNQSTTVHNPFEMGNHKFYDRDMWHVYKDELEDLGYHMLEYDWLILDNITFTIEVCLDHDVHTALKAYMADKALGSPTLIPKNVEIYDHKLKRHTGRVEYVRIPDHQAQLSLVSSAGMTVNPESMVLTNNGTIILQDGLSSKQGSMSFQSECERFSWHFEGGSEHITRTANLTPTEITFQYQIHEGHEQHGIWDDLEDENDVTWKGVIRGVFTTLRYEPKITVYATKDIAVV